MTRNPIIQEDVARIADRDLPWHEFARKTILVSGASGFLPAYMIETFLYLNELDPSMRCRVVGISRNADKVRRRFGHLWGRPDFSVVIQDVCDPPAVPGKMDFIIHAASQASPKYYGMDPVGTLSANSLGTHQMLSMARNSTLQGFLFFSSGDVYGHVEESKIPTKEDWYGSLDPTDVRSCYGESKRFGETMCAAWRHQYGVPVKVVRPAHTYGPGMALDDGRVFADFVANIVRHEDIILKSAGTARRAFCYLADATLAFFTVLLKGEVGQAYNVCNEACEVSVAELARILVGLFPERELNVRFAIGSWPGGYMPSSVARGSLDSSRLRALGWQPTTGIEEGFKRTIASYESGPILCGASDG